MKPFSLKWLPPVPRWMRGAVSFFIFPCLAMISLPARSEVRPMPVSDVEPVKPASPKSAISGVVATAGNDEQPPVASSRISVTLRQSVEVEGSRLLLDQVASCDAGLTRGFECEEILAVDLGASPLPGKTGRMARAQVKEILASEFSGADIQVSGADAAFISAKGTVLDPDSIVGPLTSQLDEAFGGAPDFRVQVVGVRVNGRPMVRPGEVVCRFAQVDMIRARTGTTDADAVASEIENFMTRIQNGAQLNAHCSQGDDEAPVHVQFTPKLQVERRMPVAAADLAAKSIFRASDATWAWVPWVRSASRALRDPAALNGLSVVRPVQAGQLLLLRDFERPLAVRRGDTVQLLQRNGGLVVTTNAVAISQGAVGDAVEVQSVATRKRIRAVIQSSSTVEAM